MIAFITLNTWVILRVIKRHAGADDYATVAVPGDTTVELPAGTVKLTYQEGYHAPNAGETIDFATPDALQVTVTSPAGELLPIKPPGFRGLGQELSTGPGWTRSVVGRIELSQAGAYTIVAGPQLDGAVEPRILLGK